MLENVNYMSKATITNGITFMNDGLGSNCNVSR